MQRDDRERDELQIYRFRLDFEGISRLDIDLSGYLLDADGKLLEGADVWQGELQLVATGSELARGSLLIVPYSTHAFTGAVMTEQTLAARHAFKPDLILEPDRRDYVLPAVPEPVWRHWLDVLGPSAQREKTSNSDFLFY